jgi:hypothetical protein
MRRAAAFVAAALLAAAGCAQIFGIDDPKEVPAGPGDDAGHDATQAEAGPDATGDGTLAEGSTGDAATGDVGAGDGGKDGGGDGATGNEASAGVLSAQPGSLDFKSVGCGSAAAQQSLQLKNGGTAPATWTAALAKGGASPFAVSPTGGSLQPGATTTVNVTPQAIPATASIAPNAFGDTLSFSATGGGVSVDLTMTARGAIVTASPSPLHMGAQPYNAGSAGQTVTLGNTGNAPVSVALATAPPFVVTPSTATLLDAGASVAVTVTFDPQSAGDAGTQLPLTATVASGDSFCAPAPAGVGVDGQGVDGPIQIALGTRHGCARYSDGNVRCWGSNVAGQLGGGTVDDAGVVFTAIDAGITGTSYLGAGWRHTCVTAAAKAYCWGFDNAGQLGYATPNGTSATPTQVTASFVAQAITGGDYTTCMIGSGLLCWGDDSMGQLAVDPATIDGGPTAGPTAVALPGALPAPNQIAMKGPYQCVRGSGSVACWPQVNFDDGGISAYPAAMVPGLSDAVDLSVSAEHACAVRATGTVVCWGANFASQLGDGTTSTAYTPVTALGIADAIAVATASQGETCVLHKGGTVSCWGSNTQGQLGNGGTTDSPTPVSVIGATGVTAIAGGAFHLCMIKSGGGVWCWGANYQGQLGDGTTNNASIPVQVKGL